VITQIIVDIVPELLLGVCFPVTATLLLSCGIIAVVPSLPLLAIIATVTASSAGLHDVRCVGIVVVEVRTCRGVEQGCVRQLVSSTL